MPKMCMQMNICFMCLLPLIGNFLIFGICRLTKEFFDHLQLELSQLKFAVSKTQVFVFKRKLTEKRLKWSVTYVSTALTGDGRQVD